MTLEQGEEPSDVESNTSRCSLCPFTYLLGLLLLVAAACLNAIIGSSDRELATEAAVLFVLSGMCLSVLWSGGTEPVVYSRHFAWWWLAPPVALVLAWVKEKRYREARRRVESASRTLAVASFVVGVLVLVATLLLGIASLQHG